ncbi:unnamed protein product, partial [Porites evermanni]
MIKIKNTDELCCARAIVTMKEYVDGDPQKQYRNLRDGRPIQERLAKQLHQEAGVPEGPCGYEELEKFQTFLGPQGYKIIEAAQIFPQARNVPFTAKSASVISMVQTVSKPIKNQKARKKSVSKRLKCCKVYKVNPKQQHKCYHDTCRHCHEFVEIYKHKCYIQRVEDVDDEEHDDDDDDDEEKKLPPLMVLADIECLIEPTEQGKQLFIADLIPYATEEDPHNVSHAFSGETCIEQFIQALNRLTEGFDSNFIIEELYRQGIKVENQLTTGAKTLKFHYGYLDAMITFKDSLCFLPMPLAELPETFNFVELHKGFFPHAFHTRESLTYRGRLP